MTRRLLMLGVGFPYADSISEYARDVAAGLDAEVAWAWPTLAGPGPRDAVARDRALRDAVPASLPGWSALLHWSPVNLGYRGLPLSSVRLPALLSARGARVVTFLHELTEEPPPAAAARRARVAWQRRAVARLARDSAAVVVTAEERRALVPDAAVVPLWSLVPALPPAPRPPGPPVLGMLGWNSPGCDPLLVAGALRRLGGDVRLLLVGRPGRHSEPGSRWAAAVPEAEFTGELPADEVSAALRGVDVYLHVDATGALPRRVSFVTALAHGLPVVVLPAPLWSRLTPGTDVVVSKPVPDALATVVRRLLGDGAERARVGAAARATYDRLLSREAGLRRLGEVLWPT